MHNSNPNPKSVNLYQQVAALLAEKDMRVCD